MIDIGHDGSGRAVGPPQAHRIGCDRGAGGRTPAYRIGYDRGAGGRAPAHRTRHDGLGGASRLPGADR